MINKINENKLNVILIPHKSLYVLQMMEDP